MSTNADHWLKRWASAGLIDAATSERIRAWEQGQQAEQKFSGPVRLLIGLGGLTIAASILLFVAAHWDTLSPFARFMLVTSTVAAFHVGGGLMTTRFPVLATTLHAVGTAALGASIFLAAQIFNLQEHWPGGVMLWAIGAWVSWFLLRDWPQLVWVAILTPAWLLGEWSVVAEHYNFMFVVASCGALLLTLAYMASRHPVLGSLGGWALLPVAIFATVYAANTTGMSSWSRTLGVAAPSFAIQMSGWLVAFLGPLALMAWLDRTQLRPFGLAAVWIAVMVFIGQHYESVSAVYYLWLAVGSAGLIAWGVRVAQRQWVNLGIAAFAITVLAFYFSSVFDKLGRSMSLLALGVLLLAGGWMLERLRKRVLTRLEDDA